SPSAAAPGERARRSDVATTAPIETRTPAATSPYIPGQVENRNGTVSTWYPSPSNRCRISVSTSPAPSEPVSRGRERERSARCASRRSSSLAGRTRPRIASTPVSMRPIPCGAERSLYPRTLQNMGQMPSFLVVQVPQGRPGRAARVAEEVERGLDPGRTEPGDDLPVGRREPLLHLARLAAPSRTVEAVDPRAALRREEPERDDPTGRAEFERAVEERAVAHEDLACVAARQRIVREPLEVPERVLDRDDVRVTGQLPDESGLQDDVRILRDVVDDDRDRGRVGEREEVLAQRRRREHRAEVGRRVDQERVRARPTEEGRLRDRAPRRLRADARDQRQPGREQVPRE